MKDMGRRNQILQFIISYITEHLYPPSFKEICEGVGLKSTSSVKMHIDHMIVEGMLETDRDDSAPRAIRVPGYAFVPVKKQCDCTGKQVDKNTKSKANERNENIWKE